MTGASTRKAGLCAENLHSAILVMKAAKNETGCDGADALNSPMDRAIAVQSPMGPHAIVVSGILANDPAPPTASNTLVLYA
jgi:hypothetical protein